jgi:RNA polymerase sigma factor (sigma-70 family)
MGVKGLAIPRRKDRRERTDAAPAGEAMEPALRVVSADAYASWEHIYNDNVDRLYRLMFAKVGNRADAEDLTAEVFLAAVPRVRAAASVGEVRAYLLAVARTVLADHWRRTLGHQITTIDPEELNQVPEATAAPGTGVAARRVARLLDALPDRYRRILQLRFLENATIRETATSMDITVANAKILQFRALRQAAAILDGEGGVDR